MSSSNHPRLKVLLQFLIVLFLLLVLLWSYLPWIAEKSLQKVLLDQGFQSVEIAEVEIDLLAGEVRLTNGVLQGRDEQIIQFGELVLRLSWSALWQKQLLIEQLALTQTQLQTTLNESGQITLLGWSFPDDSKQTSPSESGSLMQDWGFGLQQLNLKAFELTLVTPQQTFPLVIPSLQLSNVLTWHPNQSAQFSMQLRYQQTQWEMDGKGQPLADARSFKGQFHLTDLELALVAGLLPEPLSLSKGRGNLKLDWSLKQGQDAIEVDWSGRASVADIQLQADDLALANQQLSWTGQGHLRFDTAQSKVLDLAVTGQVEGDQLQLDSSRAQQPLLSLDHLALGLDLQGLDQLTVSELNLTQLQLNQLTDERIPLWVAKTIQVNQVKVTASNQIEIGHLLGQNWQMAIHMNEQQQPQQWLDWLNAVTPRITATNAEGQTAEEPESQPTETNQTTTDEPALTLKLEAFELQDSELALQFVQYEPVLKKQLQIKSLTFGPLNTQQPEAVSQIDLQASVDQYSKIGLNGTISPLLEQVETQLQAEIQGLDLHSFSPLIEQSLGYRIQSGALTAASNIKISQNQLTSDHVLKLRGLQLVDSKQSDSALSSVKLGLNLLRDDNDQIELKIPINGDLSAPNFELESVIQKALLKTLKGGTKTYLALVLQPYGAIYLAADYAYHKLGQVVLQPVEFKIGETSWLDSMPDYLHKVAEMLLNKPKLTLKLCGFYNEQDQRHWQEKGLKDAVLTQKLLELANIRQKSVKAWLVKQENISANRLSTCEPAFESLTETGVLLSM